MIEYIELNLKHSFFKFPKELFSALTSDELYVFGQLILKDPYAFAKCDKEFHSKPISLNSRDLKKNVSMTDKSLFKTLKSLLEKGVICKAGKTCNTMYFIDYAGINRLIEKNKTEGEVILENASDDYSGFVVNNENLPF